MPPLTAAVVQQEVRRSAEVDGGLKVEWTRSEYDLESGTTVFSGKVRAQYDDTVIECESLTLDSASRKGRAAGGVRVTDPEGSLEAGALDFDWENKTGQANDVEIDAGNVRAWAKSIRILPDRWELEGVHGTLSRRSKPEYSVVIPSVTVYPGKRAVARHVGLDLFGVKLGYLPNLQLSLDRRVTGWRPPAISNKRGYGLGFAWDGSFLLDDCTGLMAFASTYPKEAPSYGLQVSRSWVNPEDAVTSIATAGDLGERFGDGWFDSVTTLSPKEEQEMVGAKRGAVSLSTSFNQSTTARIEDSTDVTKPYEVSLELGGSTEGWGGFVIPRFQRIRPTTGSPYIERGQLQACLMAPSWKLLPNLDLRLRGDAFGTTSEHGQYSWVRGQVGLVAKLSRNITIGGAYSGSHEFGDPDFLFDRLYSDRTWSVRADFRSGPYTARYLGKYDIVQHKWYDQEYEIALVAEAFEPFVLVRGFPSDFRVGFRLRVDEFVSRLQRRRQRR